MGGAFFWRRVERVVKGRGRTGAVGGEVGVI